MKLKYLLILSTLFCSSRAIAEVDYSKGVFFVNEDWYGHQNSTINYLMPDDPDGNYWYYRVIQAENPGVQLGCTNQYGAIWHGRFYLIAKQEKDPGATITGGRITVADAKTMKVLFQSTIIDPSGAQCDGRGFVGVNDHKGYISSSNGVWIFDLDTYEVTGQVEGTENPNAGDDKPNTDPTGSLYHGQSGSMVQAAGRIFVAHQQSGLLVVDPAQDKVVDVVKMDIISDKAGIGSVVKSKDGTLWLSVTGDIQGRGTTSPYLIKVDPETLSTEIIDIPEADGFYPPANSWYAWTPDAFCASTQKNCLYWKGGGNSWFSNSYIFRYDIDNKQLKRLIDLDADGEKWKLYGCSMRLHPITDEIYMSLYHEFGDPTYITRRYTADGTKICDYDMITNYWFPSLPVFPQDADAFSTSVEDVFVNGSDKVIITDNSIRFINLCGQRASIYTISGTKIKDCMIESDDYHVQILEFPKGIYIVNVGRIYKKTIVK